MASFLLANLPIAPRPSTELSTSIKLAPSTETLVEDHHSASPSNAGYSSDSSSSSSENSSMDQYLHSVQTPVRTETYAKLKGNDAEFFAYNPSKLSPKSKSHRKRDRLRSVFNRKFHRLKSSSSETDSEEWGEMLAKTLFNMHHDMREIVDGFEEIETPTDVNNNTNVTFRQRQLEKLELTRMMNMLNPPNLLTYHSHESHFPYTDIVEPRHYNFLRMDKHIPEEHALIQHKPYRHRRPRYQIQRHLIKMKDNIETLKYDYYGRQPGKSIAELPSLNVQNYRNRLEKNLVNVRKQIEEYDRIHSSHLSSRQSITQIISSMKPIDPEVQAKIDNYQSKIRPVKYVEKRPRSALISAPYVPRRVHCHHHHQRPQEISAPYIDSRFDPSTVLDLTEEVEEFFGPEKPYWNRPFHTRLSISLPLASSPSDDIILPTRLGLWTRFVRSFKTKQKQLRNSHSKVDVEEQDEFYDCSTSLPQRRLQNALDG